MGENIKYNRLQDNRNFHIVSEIVELFRRGLKARNTQIQDVGLSKKTLRLGG